MGASKTMLIGACNAPGCETLTLGTLCTRHEQPVARELPRGRPFARKTTTGEPESATMLEPLATRP